MRIMKMIKLIVLMITMLALTASGAIHYARVLVDGEPSDTVIQGTPFFIEIGCDPGDTLFASIASDANDDAIFGPEDIIIVSGGIIWDNICDSTEGFLPLSIDQDTTFGRMLFIFPFSIDIGYYFLIFYDEFDSTIVTVYQAPPDTVLYSISGSVELEGISYPDSTYKNFLIWSYCPDVFFGIQSFVDSTGRYTTNWPFDPATVIVSLDFIGEGFWEYLVNELGYDFDRGFRPETTIFVDDHLTDVNFFIPLWVPDTGRVYGNIQSSSGEPLTADSLLMITFEETDWDEEGDSTIVLSSDRVIADCDSGYFEAKWPLARFNQIQGEIDYYNFPNEFMISENDYSSSFGFWDYEWGGDTTYEFNDTLFEKNDTLWIRYSYDYSTTPLATPIPFKFRNWEIGYSIAEIPPDSTCAVWLYSNEDPMFHTGYTIKFALDTLLPEDYGLYGGTAYWGNIRDTIEMLIGQQRVAVAGTLFSALGGIVNDSLRVSVSLREPPYGYYSLPAYEGIYQIQLFEYLSYEFVVEREHDASSVNYMIPPRINNFFSPGEHTLNFELYPLDTDFNLFVDIDSDDPIDDTFSVTLISPDSQHWTIDNFATNEWQSIPTYSGFDDFCLLEINNKFEHGYFVEPFTRLIENNGDIPALQGDSIYLVAELPIDEFIMEFKRDTADSWQYMPYVHEFNINYYRQVDTSLAYSYHPLASDVLSFILPIFEEQMLVKVETPWQFDLHHFLANQDVYLRVGGPYRPDRVTKYINSGSGETLLYFTGYPPCELPGENDVFVHASCVEYPDHPENNYYRDLPLYFGYYGNVMCFHDLCDGEWTFALPETLPGGYSPAFTETTIYVNDISVYPDEWDEYPIRIPVNGPPGIGGRIIINSAADPEIAYWALYIALYDASSDTIIAEAELFQYYPFNYEHFEFIFKDISMGNYIIRVENLGTGYEMFYSPTEVLFTYSGGHLRIPDIYVDYLGGIARVEITGLPAELYTGSFIEVLSVTDTSVEHPGFIDLSATYHFSDSGEIIEIPLPQWSWKISPRVLYGLTATPADTVLSSSPVDTHLVRFDYGGFSEDGWIIGAFVTDTEDPEPLVLDSFLVGLFGIDGTTVLRETYSNIFGEFSFCDLYSPSTYFVGFDYMGSSDVFIERDFMNINIPFSDTFDLGEIYVDNGNATVIVELVDISREYFDSLGIHIYSYDIPWIEDTLYYVLDTISASDTFFLCDGTWKVFAPHIEGIELVPSETTLIISEAVDTFRVRFSNPAFMDEIPGKPSNLSIFICPNPFNESVSIDIMIPEDDNVRVDIWNLLGRRIATIFEGPVEKNSIKLSWDGSLPDGGKASSGVYYFSVQSDEQFRVAKGVFLK